MIFFKKNCAEDSEKLKSEYIFEKVLTPVLCSHMDSGRQAALNKQDPSYPLLEDILRFGEYIFILNLCSCLICVCMYECMLMVATMVIRRKRGDRQRL